MPGVDSTYPPLPPALELQLEAIRIQMEFDPGYLTAEECPYSEKLKRLLRPLVQQARVGRDDGVTALFKADQTDEEEIDNLIDEVAAVINSMRSLQRDMDRDGSETTDRLNFFKNYAPMLERFLNLKEKATGLKQIYQFQKMVIETMEQVLNKDQVLEFKNKLKALNVG